MSLLPILLLLIAPLTHAEKPNIVLIMADDLGYGDLGCYGQKIIQTPSLDKMAVEGLRFTRFYAGSALCLPARCTLMTGLHSGHGRCRSNGGGGNHPPILEKDITLATVMRTAGYKTAMIGKWALGDDFIGCKVKSKNKNGSGAIYKHGWDYYFGEPNQTYNHRYYMNQMYQYDRDGLIGKQTDGQRLDVIPYPNNSKERKHYSHDLLTEKALAFIDAARDGPFFLYVPYTIPHADFDVPEIESYAREQGWSKSAKAYASMITRMDRDVGRITDRLKTHGIAEKTLVIFTSDNGSAAKFSHFKSNGEYAGRKGQLTEGGLGVPCIAWWPGKVEPGTKTDELSAFWDFMPTFAVLAGIAPPQPIDGLSLVPTLTGEGQQHHHKYLYFFLRGKDLIIRNKGETRSDEEIRKEAKTEVVVTELASQP